MRRNMEKNRCLREKELEKKRGEGITEDEYKITRVLRDIISTTSTKEYESHDWPFIFYHLYQASKIWNMSYWFREACQSCIMEENERNEIRYWIGKYAYWNCLAKMDTWHGWSARLRDFLNKCITFYCLNVDAHIYKTITFLCAWNQSSSTKMIGKNVGKKIARMIWSNRTCWSKK